MKIIFEDQKTWNPYIYVFYFLQVNSTQVSTEPINKDLGNTETSNQETLSSKNTEDFSGHISTDSGIEITTFRSTKSIGSNNEDLSPTISSIDLQGDFLIIFHKFH